jgi:ferredoxin-NADP reductase/MOSC domain-containing protein YiiM
MRLLNFSIGQVQTIQVGSEVIRTAHIKAAVAEPWRITKDGADGDQRAVHPDKLYAFAREAYAHWGKHLKIEPTRWPDGFFGENLTLDVLDEDDVRIGDVFTLGDEVELFVAGARNPCVKLAWRLSQPRTFQKVFATSKHSGVYFGVQKTGIVKPGDELRRIAHDPSMPSVADVSRFIADRAPPPLEALQRLLAFDRLSHTNRLLLSAKVEAAERAAGKSSGQWRGWRSFVIDQVIDEADGIRSFILRAEDGEILARPRPGQHVAVKMAVEDAGPLVRHWSLSSHQEDMDRYRLTIRRQSGAGSRWMHDVRPGALIKLRSPAGNFYLNEGSFLPLVLIAAGIGITPLLAMLQAHSRRAGAAAATVIYGARTPGDITFRAELEKLAAENPDLTIHFVYSQSDESPHRKGRIDADLVTTILNDAHVVLDGRRIDLPWYETDIYICGPGSMCETLKTDLIARGGNGDHVTFESFASIEAQATDLETAEVVFVRSGVTVVWTADEDSSLLELAEAAGIAIDNDCRAGTCLTCSTRVVEGRATVAVDGATTLMCIARPASARIVLEA